MVLILERVPTARFIFVRVIMCYVSITSMSMSVDCLDLETLEKFEANNRSYQDKLGESVDKTTSRFGALQCIAKSLPALRSAETTDNIKLENVFFGQKPHYPELNESKSSSKEVNNPQVIMLPPFEGSEDDKHDEAKNEEEEPTQQPQPQVNSVEDGDQEQDQIDDQAESAEPNDRQSRVPLMAQTHKYWSQKKTLWDHLKSPLVKLNKGNLTRSINNRNSKYISLRRVKRQTSNFSTSTSAGLDSNGLVNMIVRALTSTTNTLTSNTLQGVNTANAARNLMQQVLASITLIAQQLMSALIRQTAADIPRHASNLGQLFANLLTVMTIENPLIANSPLLARSNDTAEQNIISSNQTREQTDSIERSLQLLRELARETIRTARYLSGNMMTTSLNSLTSAETSTPAKQTNESRTNDSTKDENQESKLVGRIMGLTSDNFGDEFKKSTVQRTRSTRRVKRSLGTLLLFGPFSKFYMAMMVNRVIKYQSSVLSQAVVGELVRRFVVPSVTSSLTPTAAGVTNLLNQVKQTLSNVNNQILQTAKMPPKSPIRSDHKISAGEAREPQKNSFEESSARPVIFDADCELADPGGLKLYQDFAKNIFDPRQLLLHHVALNKSAINFDQRGLTIDTPHSKVTIPGLQSYQQALIKLMNGSNEVGDNLLVNTTPQVSHWGSQQFIPSRQRDEPVRSSQEHFDSHVFHLNRSSPLRGSKLAHSPYDIGFDTSFSEQAFVNLLSNQLDQQTKILQTPKILNESLSNATSSQLLELLSQIYSQQQQKRKPSKTDDQFLQQLKFINMLSNLILSNSSVQTDIGGRLPTLDRASQVNKVNSSHVNPSTSANSIAEKILNSTLETSVANLIQASNLSSEASSLNNNNKLVKDTSDLLVNSFAHIIRGLEFNTDATKNGSNFARDLENLTKHEVTSTQKSPIQITLSPENAATLIGELMSSMKKVNEDLVEMANMSMPLVSEEVMLKDHGREKIISIMPPTEQVLENNSALQGAKIEQPPELPAQTARELQQILQREALQNQIPIKESILTELSLMPANQNGPTVKPEFFDLDQQAMVSVNADPKETALSDIKIRRQKVERNKPELVVLGSSRSKQTRSNQVPATNIHSNQPNSTQFYPGYVQNFAKNTTPNVSQTPLPRVEQNGKMTANEHGGDPNHMRVSHLNDEKLWKTDTPNSPHIKRLQAETKAKPKLIERKSPIGTTRQKSLQGSNNHGRLAKDEPKYKIEQNVPIREAQASTTIHHVSTELPSQVQISNKVKQQQQRENLNNIAMALNVMNMVLLNQKLAGNSSDNIARVTKTSSPKLIKQKLRQYEQRHKGQSNSASNAPKSTNISTKLPDLERENITIPSNHRTPTNNIKLNSKLIVAKGMRDNSNVRTISLKSGRYSFQPLIVNPQVAGRNRSELDYSLATESDLEHADRWNDVLAHLDFAAS